MLYIDGSHGEGGGQILRTALALSMVTGRPFRIDKIRAKRRKPGLMRQHLTGVRAAAAICDADLKGATLNSQTLSFSPRRIRGGDYHFDVGTAGSTMLVLQTVLVPLLFAEEPSRLVLEGGTHAISAPVYEFIDRVYLPLLRKMGAQVEMQLENYGFFPVGGGRVSVKIEPASQGLSRLELTHRGEVVDRSIRVISAFLPEHIAEREIEAFCEVTGWPEDIAEIEDTEDAECPGNIIIAEVSFETHRELFAESGKRGRPAEEVAQICAEEVLDFLNSGGAVGEHLCDQLLLPMALGEGGRLTTTRLTEHSRTQFWVIPQFVDIRFDIDESDERSVEICL